MGNFGQTLDTVDKRTQKEFRRKMNRLSKLGGISLVLIRGELEIGRHLDRYLEFRRRTWKGVEPHPEFYRRLCAELETRGECYFCALTLADEPIAYLISFLRGDTIYGIQTTYDPSYYAFSPGVILFYKFIEHISDITGLREFDIGRGNEQFKREWTSLTYTHARLIAFPDTPAWRLFTGARYKTMPLVRSHRRLNAAYLFLRGLAAPKNEEQPSPPARITYHRKPLDACAGRDYLVRSAVRSATAEDLDDLAVTMSARNFKEIEELFKTRRGVVITEGDRVVACYWLPIGDASATVPRDAPETISVDRWGMIPSCACPEAAEAYACAVLDWLERQGMGASSMTLEMPEHSHLREIAT
jgi:hypothetical protein